MVIDAAAVFDGIAAAEPKVPNDTTMTIHALKLRELLSLQQINRLIWIDTRSMLADGLNKGSVDRLALRTAVECGRWDINQDVRVHKAQSSS